MKTRNGWLAIAGLLGVCGYVMSLAGEAEPAGASAERRNDGSVRVRSLTPSEIRAISAKQNSISHIDQQFPVEPIPATPPHTFQIVSVSDQGIFVTSERRKLRLDGVECTPAGIENIRALVVPGKARVAFIDSPPVDGEPIPANLWLVEIFK
jgi:hypothetical protein